MNDASNPVCVVSLASAAYARVRAFGLLEGSDLVEVFERSMDGTRYVRDAGSRLTPVESLSTVLERLKRGGFRLTIEPGVQAALEEHAETRAAALAAAEARTNAIDEALYQSTLLRDGIGSRLFSYQRRGVTWLAGRHAALLADDMRLGKTLQVIAAIPDDAPIVVVAPAAVKGVWRAQVARWRPGIRVSVLQGRKSFRWPEPGEMIVTNYEILPRVHVNGCKGSLPDVPCKGCKKQVGGFGTLVRVGHLPECTGKEKARRCSGCNPIVTANPAYGPLPGTVFVMDEGHVLKNRKAHRTMSARAMAEACRTGGGYSWIVTGTPLENEPPELWSVLTCGGLAEEAYGTYEHFVTCFGGERAPFKYPGQAFASMVWGEATPEAAERLQRVMLRRLRHEVLPDLPTKTYGDVLVELDTKRLRTIDKLIKKSSYTIDQIVELVERGTASFHELSSIRSALAIAKTPALLEYVAELETMQKWTAGSVEARNSAVLCSDPLIVFSAHRFAVDALAQRPGWGVITGDEPAEARTETVERFQRGELRGIALTIRAGGTGIELSRGSHVIFLDRDWNPAANAQAEDRPMGLNQKRGVTITPFVADHDLDRRVNAVLARKLLMIASTVDRARTAA